MPTCAAQELGDRARPAEQQDDREPDDEGRGDDRQHGQHAQRRLARKPVRVTISAKARPSSVVPAPVSSASSSVFQATPQRPPPERQPRLQILRVEELGEEQRRARGRRHCPASALVEDGQRRIEDEGRDQRRRPARCCRRRSTSPLTAPARGEPLGQEEQERGGGQQRAPAHAELAHRPVARAAPAASPNWMPRRPMPKPCASHQARPPSAGRDQDPGGPRLGGAAAQRQRAAAPGTGRCGSSQGLPCHRPWNSAGRVVIVPRPAVRSARPGRGCPRRRRTRAAAANPTQPTASQKQERPARIADPAAGARVPLPASVRQRVDLVLPLLQQPRALVGRAVLGEVVVDQLDRRRTRAPRAAASRPCSTAPGRPWRPWPGSGRRRAAPSRRTSWPLSRLRAPLMMLIEPIS